MSCHIEEFGKEVVCDYERIINILYNMLEEAGVELHLMSIPTNIVVENEIVTSMDYVQTSKEYIK